MSKLLEFCMAMFTSRVLATAFLAFATTLGAGLVGPAGAGTELKSFDSAKILAADGNRLILLEFGAEWCGPCKVFARDAKDNPQLAKALEKIVFHGLDAEKGEGLKLAPAFSVQGYPTFVLTDPTGTTVDRWTGYMGAQDFIESLEAAIADPTTVEAKQARLAKSPTARDAAHLARIASSAWDLQAAVDLYRRAQELDANGAYAYPIFETTAQGWFTGKAFTQADVQKAAAAVLAAPQTTPIQQVELASLMSGVAEKAKDPSVAVPYLKAAVAASNTSTDPRVVAGRRDLMVDHALYVEAKPELAARYKRESMPEGWMDDPNQLNKFAWWCFEKQIELDEALNLARRGAELASPGSQKAMLLDTAAEISNLQGHRKDAVALIEKARAEDPKNDYYVKQLERFQKELAAKK